MSGQPYKYYTDVTKFRTEYMEALGLRADIDALNNDANRTYKETGQMPAVSQMKDNRTTSEILSDSLKLKSDLIIAIAKISSQQFGQLVVQRIQQHPLNIDNKLLIFTAQRIDDIVDNITRIYKYGIKGDSNDAEQLVNFITTMYNDKNSITAQTKNFMDRQGLQSMGKSGSVFLNLYTYLTRLNVNLLNMQTNLNLFTLDYDPNLEQQIHNTGETLAEISSLIKSINEVLPNSQDQVTTLEHMLQNIENFINDSSIKTEPTPTKRGTYVIEPSFVIDNSQYENARKFLDFINTSLPSIPMLTSIESQLNIYYEQVRNNIEQINEFEYDENDENNVIQYKNLLKSTNISVIKLQTVLDNLYSILLPNTEWTEYDIIKLKEIKIQLVRYTQQQQQQTQTQQQQQQQQQQSNNFGNIQQLQNPQSPFIEELTTEPNTPQPQLVQTREQIYLDGVPISREIYNEMNFYAQNIIEILNILEYNDLTPPELSFFVENINNLLGFIPDTSDLLVTVNTKIDELVTSAENLLKVITNRLRVENVTATGNGIKQKQRGRPRGCGISKSKTYKESVRAHTTLDKGIQETPRFIKFGKYLLNNHKLNNENVFSLKRPSGGNIVEIPSTKLSNNLSSVIKKMVGGSIPTYSDISKLSEPEKVYLHKISRSSNILDKFDIPAPNKDQQEKDVHEFEVLKGEIMAGNDSKELIKKFKVHIMKLSKNGTLNKQEVHEILSELLDLGY